MSKVKKFSFKIKLSWSVILSIALIATVIYLIVRYTKKEKFGGCHKEEEKEKFQGCGGNHEEEEKEKFQGCGGNHEEEEKEKFQGCGGRRKDEDENL